MPSQLNYPWASEIVSARLGLVCGLLVACQGGNISAQQPSWQSGRSLWNGQGYDTLPAPAPTPHPVPGPARSPTSPETPTQWQQGFGLSQPPGQSPEIEEVPLGDPRIANEGVYLTAPSGARAGDEISTEPESLGDLPIGARLDEAAPLDEPPLQEEIVQWYQIPWRWVTKGWTNHAELGLNGSTGNAVTNAIQTGLEMKRKTDTYTLGIDFNYRQASTQGRNTEDNARLNIDYDRLLADTNWTHFAKLGLAYDKFKAFDLRLNVNTGLGYYWIRNDTTNFITRAGAGASREFGAPIDRWTPEAVFGFEMDHQLSERQKVTAKLDYFPSLRDLTDFRAVTDVAWETLIDEAENLSLRLSVTDRYDSTPQGALPNDVYYAALLLYKF